jgi:DUF4097 and DUF4098 domain-containing protein YvlB
MLSMRRATRLSVCFLTLIFVASLALAETRKEFRFTVGPNASISVLNQYGPIAVKPSSNNQVTVIAILHSDRVEVDQDQSASRVEIRSHLLPGANAQSGQVDYEVLVPAGASVNMYSPTGPLRAEKLAGDVSLEGANAVIDVHDVSNAHVHVKTMNGPVTLTNIQGGHVEITSVSGDVRLTEVSGPLVHVSCTSGKIFYDGDFGAGGQYSLISHSGDIEAIIPPAASFDVTARSMKGKVENDFPFQPKSHTSFPLIQGSSFAGTIGQASSSVVLKSFSGKIRLKKR